MTTSNASGPRGSRSGPGTDGDLIGAVLLFLAGSVRLNGVDLLPQWAGFGLLAVLASRMPGTRALVLGAVAGAASAADVVAMVTDASALFIICLLVLQLLGTAAFAFVVVSARSPRARLDGTGLLHAGLTVVLVGFPWLYLAFNGEKVLHLVVMQEGPTLEVGAAWTLAYAAVVAAAVVAWIRWGGRVSPAPTTYAVRVLALAFGSWLLVAIVSAIPAVRQAPLYRSWTGTITTTAVFRAVEPASGPRVYAADVAGPTPKVHVQIRRIAPKRSRMTVTTASTMARRSQGFLVLVRPSTSTTSLGSGPHVPTSFFRAVEGRRPVDVSLWGDGGSSLSHRLPALNVGRGGARRVSATLPADVDQLLARRWRVCYLTDVGPARLVGETALAPEVARINRTYDPDPLPATARVLPLFAGCRRLA